MKWFFNNFEEIIGAISLFLMALLAFINVITRYFIKYSLAPTEELEVSGLVFITMLGASVALKRDQHLRLMYLDRKVGEKTRFYLTFFSHILTFIFFSILTYLSYFHIKDEIELNITTEALNIPEWIYVAAIPFGSVIINIRVVQKIIKLIKDRK